MIFLFLGLVIIICQSLQIAPNGEFIKDIYQRIEQMRLKELFFIGKLKNKCKIKSFLV